jgi:catechol 2,3-dioxygenase-like lactoylglutathione lyase family enzyme
MNTALTQIHHIALTVADLKAATKWYQSSFNCEIVFEGRTEVQLQFANVILCLILPSQEPGHVAFVREDAHTIGELRKRNNGIESTYIADPTGNTIEIVSSAPSVA